MSLNSPLDLDMVLDVLRVEARKSFELHPSGIKYASDDEQAVRYGALNPRIAYALQWPNGVTLRHLKRIESQGKVIRYQSYKGGMSRWWPVGLLAEIKGEQHGE